MKLSQVTQQFLDDDGNPLNAGYAYYYEPDGAFSTEKTVYKDKAGAVAWTQPIVFGADGRPVGADIFENGDYDRKIFDSADNLIRSERNIGDTWSAVGTDLSQNLVSNHSAEVAGTGAEPFANWTNNDSSAAITRDTTDSIHGGACFLWTDAANEFEHRLTSDAFEVSPELNVALSFHVKASNAAAQPRIRIRWLDKDQAFISASTVYNANLGLTPTDWTYLQGFRATPPATARYANLLLEGNIAATQYTTCFDGIQVSQVSVFPEEAPYAPYGLILSRDSGDTDHDIKVTAGAVKSDDYANDIILQSDIVKRFDATWAAGTGNGGASSGFSLPASGDFAVWLVKNSSTGQVDVLASASYTAPTMPSGYDVKRLIGYCTTDSSNNIVDFVHVDNIFYQKAKITDVSDSSITDDTAETGTFSVPPGSIGFFNFYWNFGSGQTADLAILMGPTGTATSAMDVLRVDPTSATMDELNGMFQILVDSSSQADYAVRNGSGGALTGTGTIYTKGCIMLTRDAP
jgi:hypothetical protein